jgi:excinuclease ABC subunit A
MGPEGGSGGGIVVATGTPEDLVDIEVSHTGHFLRHMIYPPDSDLRLARSGPSEAPKRKRAPRARTAGSARERSSRSG